MIAVGGLLGFIIFIYDLESKGMGNIVIRNGKFSPASIWQYIKSPFNQSYLWQPKLLRHNWIVIVSFCMILSKFASKY